MRRRGGKEPCHLHQGNKSSQIGKDEFSSEADLGRVAGTPPLPDREARERWIEVCTTEYRLLRSGAGGNLLRNYAAVNPGEFFAVATEVFFDLPGEMRALKPDLYGVLRDFYRQDPARREELAAARTRPDPEPRN